MSLVLSVGQAEFACFHSSFLKYLLIVSISYFQVLKVDGAYVAVKFPGTSSNTNCQNSSGPDADPSSLLQDCRLLRIDELQVFVWELRECGHGHMESVTGRAKSLWLLCRLSKLVVPQKFLTVSRGLPKSFVYLRRLKY